MTTLIVGGLFLLVKSGKRNPCLDRRHEDGSDGTAKKPSFMSVLIQIAMLDIVFSLDSVITAVGMAGRPMGDGDRRDYRGWSDADLCPIKFRFLLNAILP
ncbi:MAG: hypothetical protein U0905_13120 [Pirellulales bacterium]